METKRQIRVSGLNDYVAVDLIDDKGKIIKEVFISIKISLLRFHLEITKNTNGYSIM